MTPLVVLYIIPIGLIAFAIIAIIRLIIRASNKGNNSSNTYQAPYTPPPQNPGQYGQQNPGQNPYTNQPTNAQQPPWQNPGTYQQPNYTQQPNTPPDYTQQTYTPPDYTKPNYQQPNYTQPDYSQGNFQQTPGGAKRSTSIPGGYATQIPDAPKKSNTTVIVVAIIIAVVVLLGGFIAFAVSSKNGGGALTSSSFALAYENPTDNTYYIILDDWDTIKVEPHTASNELDYTFRKDLENFHWVMTTEGGDVIADTTVSRRDVEQWQNDRTSYTYINSLIIFNPSRSEFVYYTAWYDDIGIDYMDSVAIGDTTYFADAYSTTAAFIFDERDPEYIKELSEASNYGSDQNQFLVSAADFAVLFQKLNGNTQYEVFENYREQLLELYTVANDEIMANNKYDADDLNTVYDLANVTPAAVSQNTEARDFVPAIDFVKDHTLLFKATAPDQFQYIVDSADVVLKHSYTPQDRNEGYAELRQISYSVIRDGLFDDQPRREIYYEYDRDPITAQPSY